MIRSLLVTFMLLHFAWLFISNSTRPLSMQQKNAQLISEGFSQLQDGDIVVRKHNDITSDFIQHLNRKDKQYTHAGIVLFENGYPYVYHMLRGGPGEHAVRKDSLSVFCRPSENLAFGIYRYLLKKEELQQLHTIVEGYRQQQIPFDMSFDIDTDSALYCSELVYKAFLKATKERVHMSRTRIGNAEAVLAAAYFRRSPMTFVGKEGVAVDDLYCNAYCRKVAGYKF